MVLFMAFSAGRIRLWCGSISRRFPKSTRQKILYAQVGSHLVHIGKVGPLALDLEHTQHVAPLAIRVLAAHAVPVQFGQDGILRTEDVGPALRILGQQV